MRATTHNGRFGSPKHNGRNFDLDKARHIDKEKTKENVYWFWDMDEYTPEGYEGCEARYYNQKFSAALAEQNERHIQARHEDRIKTMDDWLKSRNTRPEESIYQLGDMKSNIHPPIFKAMAQELLNSLIRWSREHGEPYAVLDAAIHIDEASCHMQVRKVWQYRDNGVWKIGQNKALEAAGVELPEPGEPVSAKNNRKITFDHMIRDTWLNICQKYGYDVERTPRDGHSEHLSKEALIYLREMETKAQEALEEAQMARQEAQEGLEKVKSMFGHARAVKASCEAVNVSNGLGRRRLPSVGR